MDIGKLDIQDRPLAVGRHSPRFFGNPCEWRGLIGQPEFLTRVKEHTTLPKSPVEVADQRPYVAQTEWPPIESVAKHVEIRTVCRREPIRIGLIDRVDPTELRHLEIGRAKPVAARLRIEGEGVDTLPRRIDKLRRRPV